VTDPNPQEILNQLCAEAGVDAVPLEVRNGSDERAVAWGRNKRVIVGGEFLASSQRVQRVVLAHELSHIIERKRRDIALWVFAGLYSLAIAVVFAFSLTGFNFFLMGGLAFLVSLHFIRRDEFGADRFAVWLTQDLDGFIEMADEARSEHPKIELINRWLWPLFSHPSWTQRIEHVVGQAELQD
jgi:Zn-dependent protease with chaperone function